MNASVVNDMAETVHSFGVKIAFLFLQEELRLAQLVEYEPKVFLVVVYGIAKHEYIVKIYVYKSPDEFSEDCSHQPLKGSWCIAIPLLHRMTQKCAVNCGKCSFPHVAWFHTYLFVRIRHIDL